MADTAIGASLTLDPKQANQSVASFKAELRAAQQEVITLTDKFGATSKAAMDAAKRAAELKDRIGDAKKLVDSFNPDEKFRGFTQVLTGVAGGFSAITGAMGLLGVESVDVQKQLLKVQSALAITQGLNSIGDSIQSFKNLGATLVQSLGKGGAIGLAIAGVSLLAAGFLGLFDNAKKLSESEKALADSTKDYSKAAAGAIEQVTKVRTAFDLARTGVISKEAALKTYNETLGDSFGKTNDLATAENNLADNAEAYIKMTGLKAQANALFAKSADLMAQLVIDQQNLEKASKDAADNSVGFLQYAIKKQTAATQVAIDARKVQAKDIENLGAGLLRQAEVIAKGSGILSVEQQKVNTDALKSANEASKKFLADREAALKSANEASKKFLADREAALKEFNSAIEATNKQEFDSNEQALINLENQKAKLLKIRGDTKLSPAEEEAFEKAWAIVLGDIKEEDRKRILENIKKFQQKILDDAAATLVAKQKILQEQFDAGEITQQQLGEQSLQNQIDLDQQLVDNKSLTADKIAEIQKRLTDELITQSKAEADAEIKITKDALTIGNALLDQSVHDHDISSQDAAVQKQQKLIDQLQAEIDIRTQHNQDVTDLQTQLTAATIDLSNKQKDAVQINNDAELASRIGLAQAIEGIVQNLGALFGKATAASKIAALADIAINTGIGFVQGLDIAQKSAKATGPGAAFAFPIFYAAQIAAVLGAAARAKAILQSGNTTGASSVSLSTPSAPLAPKPQVSTTSLDQQTLNQSGSAAVRAFVVESDVTHNQEQISRLNRAARLGG